MMRVEEPRVRDARIGENDSRIVEHCRTLQTIVEHCRILKS